MLLPSTAVRNFGATSCQRGAPARPASVMPWTARALSSTGTPSGLIRVSSRG
jgi:hypothetical protein